MTRQDLGALIAFGLLLLLAAAIVLTKGIPS